MNASHFVKGFIGFMFSAIIIGCVSNPTNTYDDISHIQPLNEIPVIVVDPSDLIHKDQFDCMQANIYFEAGNQKSDEAMAAVGYVTLNRSINDNKTICQIVKQKKKRSNGRWVCQFSWHCDNKSDIPPLTRKVVVRTKLNGQMVSRTKTVPNVAEQKAWDRAGRIALQVITKTIDNPVDNATMYHATYVKPGWDYNKLVTVKRIETHIFYSLKA